MKDLYYLDYNATTPVDDRVLDDMLPYLKENFQNPSSSYASAMTIMQEVETARKSIASATGASSHDEIIFTGSATESINHAIRGTLKAYPKKNHIITSAVEHPAVLETCQDIKRDGYKLSVIDVNSKGELDIEELKAAVTPETAIISIMHANNETGVVFDIGKIAKSAKDINSNVVFHTDATQAFGKLPIKMNDGNFKYIDLLSMSGHKIYAPKGIGILYSRKGSRLRKFITGGHQEFNKRAGTTNVPFIIALAKAFELIGEDLQSGKSKKIAGLRDYLEAELKKRIPYMRINGEGAERLSNTSNMSFDCIEGESILFELDRNNICVSSGSACTSGSLEPSHVLRAMNVPLTSAHSSIRVSLGRFTKKDDVDHFISTLPGIVEALRNISPFWDRKNNKPDEKALKYVMP
ncbi:MAG: aminotransferase class V-fold PLP-dependent enzyme [Oligoflexia bacterium]|nr:aminotransferase class V-fold PLP-dependent enzyme [Oligoflexia bacterium]